MNEILTSRVHGEIDLRTKNALRRDDGSQIRFLTHDRTMSYLSNLCSQILLRQKLEGKLLRKVDALKNVIT